MSQVSICIGILAAATLGVGFAPSQASAQSVRSPSCAKSIDISDGSLGISGSYICVGELDNNGLQQIIVGQTGQNSGYTIIIENTGTVRRRVCWATSSPSCPTAISQ
jgi:hypothetical protein